MDIVIKPYHSLPCELEVFTINGIKADKDDFGEGYDHEWENDEPYGCGYHRFDAKREYEQSILDKYNITPEEYLEICDLLEDKLYVGSCGWCV